MADLAAEARARRDELRLAFADGMRKGSMGIATSEDIAQAFRYSETGKRLRGNPPGRNIVGRGFLCSDARGAGREVWYLVALHRDRAWVTSDGVDLVVVARSLRDVVSMELLEDA